MTTGVGAHLPTAFRAFPGVVALVTADGTIVESNGRLERELGRPVVGTPFADVLDLASCGDKWARALMAAGSPNASSTCELVLVNHDRVTDPRAFSVLGEEDRSVVWVIEHPTDPRLDAVSKNVTGVNSELANMQRDLVRERARLAHALDETERLASRVNEQNHALGERNEELVVMTEELVEQRRELERSNRALDEFAHAVSHDLKAPLRSVANYARWIEEDLSDVLTGETRAHMELLRAQVERMRAMINGVLEYSRSGRMRVPTEIVDTNSVVTEVVALLDPPPTCVIEVADGLPTFAAERAPLRQVLMNLIGNAIKHSRRPDTHVRVSATDIGDAYKFSVQDNGPGIAPRAHEKIWMLFHTLTPREATANGASDGTGIGLAIVRQLVELQGGRAWVESELGQGATFHFVWPNRVAAPSGDAPDAVE